MSEQKKEIYTYKAPWSVYSMAWSNRAHASSQYRLAVCSFVEKYSNQVQIISRDSSDGAGTDEEMIMLDRQQKQTGEDLKDGEGENDFYCDCTFDHPYPCTKVMFAPQDYNIGSSTEDLLATTADYLRIWSLKESHSSSSSQQSSTSLVAEKSALLNNQKSSEYCAPLTSFDWNAYDPNMIATCSIDSTIIVWDLDTKKAKTQLIAHDKEVFDVAFAPRNKDVFASVGADGSARMFDLRSLEHSTIIYESPNFDPLLRLSWNNYDPNYIATFTGNSNRTTILDIRLPSIPVAQLGGHMANINALSWAPHSSCHICTVGEDRQALIWELTKLKHSPMEDPILAYNADGEINNLLWSSSHSDWIAIAFDDKVQMCKCSFYF